MNSLDLSKFKSCACGTQVNSDNSLEKEKYSWIGWFFWSMGTTAIPKKITFICKKCGHQFEKLTDRELIKYYIYYKRH